MWTLFSHSNYNADKLEFGADETRFRPAKDRQILGLLGRAMLSSTR